MKKIIIIAISIVLSFVFCSSLFAEKMNLTLSMFSDVRLKTWITKRGASSEYDNSGNVRTGLGPSISFFYNFNDRFEAGSETKMIIREGQLNKYYMQVFSTAIARWKFFGNKRCSLFYEFATGPVFSYLGRDLASYGCDFELGAGMRFSLANNKYITLKTNLVGILEHYKNAENSSATVFVLSSQPMSIGFSWKY